MHSLWADLLTLQPGSPKFVPCYYSIIVYPSESDAFIFTSIEVKMNFLSPISLFFHHSRIFFEIFFVLSTIFQRFFSFFFFILLWFEHMTFITGYIPKSLSTFIWRQGLPKLQKMSRQGFNVQSLLFPFPDCRDYRHFLPSLPQVPLSFP